MKKARADDARAAAGGAIAGAASASSSVGGGAARRRLVAAVGWAAFGLGWLGVFLPGLPTTIFWIIAAFAFLRANRRMYERIIANKRFGPGVRLFVEEGKIRRGGKVVSIVAMMSCATIGAFAIPVPWVRIVVVAAAVAGSAWVASLPTPAPAAAVSEEAAAE